MKPTYEEQIRAIGNGKLLQSGCYDENLNLLSEDYRDASGLKDNVAYVIIPEGVTILKKINSMSAVRLRMLLFRKLLRKSNRLHLLIALNLQAL